MRGVRLKKKLRVQDHGCGHPKIPLHNTSPRWTEFIHSWKLWKSWSFGKKKGAPSIRSTKLQKKGGKKPERNVAFPGDGLGKPTVKPPPLWSPSSVLLPWPGRRNQQETRSWHHWFWILISSCLITCWNPINLFWKAKMFEKPCPFWMVPKEPLKKRDIPNKYPLYKVYMGLIIGCFYIRPLEN